MGSVLELQSRLKDVEEHSLKLGSDIRGEHQKLEIVTKDLQGRLSRYGDKVDDMQGQVKEAMQVAQTAQSSAQTVRNYGVAGAPSSLSGATIPLASAPDSLLPDLNGDLPTGRRGTAGEGSGEGGTTTSPVSPGTGSDHGESPRAPVPMAPGYSHIDPEPLPYITKRRFEEAITSLREDMKAWLRLLQDSVIAALQQKADQAELHNALESLAISQGLDGENIALFAKRALIGRCASCDTPFQVEHGKIRLPEKVGLQAGIHPRDSLGAQVSIRAPEAGQLRPPVGPGMRRGSGATLPRIEKAANKDFPKGKVLRASSDTDLRVSRGKTPPMVV